MSSSAIHVTAIVTPAKGKESRVRELLTDLAGKVEKQEPEVSKYHLFEQYDSESGTNVFVVQEIYKDKSTYDKHFKTEYFQALGETVQKEELLSGPLNIMTVKPIAGYNCR
ncbi:Dimeric alpha+beta barrel [Glarea lozoyensis ATCC 20868]|uniref:Dimeric alpha+beta barrel n=2 Tax=Glarea lozoyensis TaxID=101852 RepID=S3DKE1_GLAL2|nr:Dimeric alpha+beta barrel [Glarea lozoyensis ATCC 20868]EHK98622.1 hypothetical protein M7I_5563 [Glarea lozoyensis 74030]EPE32526.1 Dimeric alpha+beta barrel [Glarea lozoyensis ATCC 20868]